MATKTLKQLCREADPDYDAKEKTTTTYKFSNGKSFGENVRPGQAYDWKQ